MRKHIILLGGITAAAAICVSIIGVTLYEGSSRTDIRQYDLYGDPTAADGITYTAQIKDCEGNLYADITNTLGGESRTVTHFSSADNDNNNTYDWYTSFNLIYGIQSASYDAMDSGSGVYIDGQPYYIKKMIKDCLAKTDSETSETSEDFRINLQDYTDKMPYVIEVDTLMESYYVSYPLDINDPTWSDLFDLFTIPLLDPYYVNIHVEKNENGDLLYVTVDPETEWYTFNVDGFPVEDSNSYLFYYAPNYAIWETNDTLPNTVAAVMEKDVCGLYLADFQFDGFEKIKNGYQAGDFLGIQLTKLDQYSDYLYNIGWASIDETAVAETGKAIWLFRTEAGVLLETADQNGILNTLEIALPQEDTSEYLMLEGTNQTEDGICSCILSDGTAIFFREEADGSLSELFTSKLMSRKEESEMIKAAIPGYTDNVRYFDYIEYTYITSDDIEDDIGDENTDDIEDDGTGDGSDDNTEDTTDYAEEEIINYPNKTWSDSRSIMLYKDNRIAFITQADRYTTAMGNPGSVYVTVYDSDGLQYAGFFRSMYTSYIYRGFYDINWFISDHYVSESIPALTAVWN